MKVELEHHDGWRQYEVEADTIEGAAYAAVRQSHEFLADDNHGHEFKRRPAGHASVVIRYNQKSSATARNRLTPAWDMTDPGDLWFGVPYRAVEGK